MNVSATGKTDGLLAALGAKGLTSAKARLVETELQASVKTVASGGGTVDKTAVRAALDQRIAADVASGKLTQKDADAVKTALDKDAAPRPTTGAAGSAKPARGGGGGGGGAAGGAGGGTASKTELSRSVVVTGAMETITITYTDGTTATETEASTAGETAKSSASPSKADPYAETIPPGSLVDQIG